MQKGRTKRKEKRAALSDGEVSVQLPLHSAGQRAGREISALNHSEAQDTHTHSHTCVYLYIFNLTHDAGDALKFSPQWSLEHEGCSTSWEHKGQEVCMCMCV